MSQAERSPRGGRARAALALLGVAVVVAIGALSWKERSSSSGLSADPPGAVTRGSGPAPARPSVSGPARFERRVLLRILVGDAGGGPIASALVRTNERDLGRTDTRGVLELSEVEDLPASGSLSVRAEGYAEGTAKYDLPGEVEVQLLPESSVSGVVVRADNQQPLTDLLVTVGDARARSGPAGLFTVRSVVPGEHRPTARGDHWFGQNDRTIVVVPGKVVTGVRILASSAYRIDGSVWAADRPLRSGAVSTEGSTAKLAEDGRFSLTGMPPGRHEIHLHGSGTTSFAAAAATTEVEITDRDVAVRIDLGPRFTVPVLLVDDAGAPITGARVHATTSVDAVAYNLSGVTDSRGACRFEDVPTGPLEVVPGPGVKETKVMVPLTGGEPLRLVVPRMGVLQGRLQTPDGKSPSPRVITVLAEDPEAGRAVRVSDPSGGFVFERLLPGGYDLEVRFPLGPVSPTSGPIELSGREPAELTQTFQVQPGEITHLQLGLPAEDAVISGRVEDARSLAIAAAEVSLDAASEPTCPPNGRPGLYTTIADQQGRFTFPALPRGRRFRAVARRENGACAVTWARSGDTELVLSIAP